VTTVEEKASDTAGRRFFLGGGGGSFAWFRGGGGGAWRRCTRGCGEMQAVAAGVGRPEEGAGQVNARGVGEGTAGQPDLREQECCSPISHAGQVGHPAG